MAKVLLSTLSSFTQQVGCFLSYFSVVKGVAVPLKTSSVTGPRYYIAQFLVGEPLTDLALILQVFIKFLNTSIFNICHQKLCYAVLPLRSLKCPPDIGVVLNKGNPSPGTEIEAWNIPSSIFQ